MTIKGNRDYRFAKHAPPSSYHTYVDTQKCHAAVDIPNTTIIKNRNSYETLLKAARRYKSSVIMKHTEINSNRIATSHFHVSHYLQRLGPLPADIQIYSDHSVLFLSYINRNQD